MRTPSVSVVIPTHRRPELLRRSLAALCEDPAATEIIVVHDPGDAKTSSIIAMATDRHPHVRAVEAPRDEGGAEREQPARDAGVRSASGEFVLAVDDDVIAHPGLVTGHARRHAAREDTVVVGYMPVVLPPRGVPGRAAATLYSNGYERVIDAYNRASDTILTGLWGGNVSLSRAHWLAAIEDQLVAGGYHGDQAFGLRLRDQGLHGVFDRSLRGDHWYRRTLAQVVADARSAAVGRARIGSAYPGSYEPGAYSARPAFRLVLGGAVRLIASDGAWQRVLAALSMIAREAAKRRLHGVEYVVTRLTWRLAFDRARARP